MWIRDDKHAVNLETGMCVVLAVQYAGDNGSNTVRIEHDVTLRNPVRACDETEVVAMVKKWVGDGQKALQP